MSSQSPRGSVSGVTSDEVALDFAESLKDLQNNNRYEISNLTIIAKENTEHAQAISQALENHIKTAPPSRKLPALFVLDSIVKNVGTPYTVYLGRNLYQSFMNAYTLVDSTARRNMEGMLKTWREPVPGSIDPRPVFPREKVQPIETALLKAKTAVLNSQKASHPIVPHRMTGTPPQQDVTSAAHLHPPFAPQYSSQPSMPPLPQQQQHYVYPHPQPPNLANEVEGVKRDIEALIPRFQHQLACSPHDGNLQKQLGALQALSNLLATQHVSAPELQQIRNQVSQLSPGMLAQTQPTPQPVVPAPQWEPPVSFPQSYQHPPSAYNPAPPQQQLPAAAAPLLAPDALSGLQALLSTVQKPSTPQLRAAVPGFHNASHSQLHAVQAHSAAITATNGTRDLIASLTKAGLINPVPNVTPSVPPPVLVPPPIDPTASLLKSLQGILPPQGPTGTPLPTSGPTVAPAPVTTASLRALRPDLIYSLYDAQPNQCSTCGRRFPATEEGRSMKSRHLDWHFRTNQRIADPNTNRGHHRNWYVDEMEWITHTEFDPSTTTASAADTETAAKHAPGPQDQFIRAPPGMTKNTCNICYEEMKSSYSEDLQDWIFVNATWHSGKIVHATCLAEMTGIQPPAGGLAASSLAAALASVGAGLRERSATPESSLGKRKAETVMVGNGPRMKFQ